MITELFNKEYIILDGAMGTMLQNNGLKLGDLPEVVNITNSEIVTNIHRQYIEAGSDIIYTNTFGANKHKYGKTEFSVQSVIEAAVNNARRAADEALTKHNRIVKVALDIGPIGKMLMPIGDMSFDEAYDMFAEMVKAGHNADIIVIETMTNLMEVKAALLAVKENSKLPVICTMSFEENGRTFTGCTIESMALTLEALGADAIGINCSLGPRELLPFVETLSKYTSLPIVLKPNAGLPDPITNTYNVSAEEFADIVSSARRYGTVFFGGCCGTNPDFIRCLSKRMGVADSCEDVVNRDETAIIYNRRAVCSQSEYVRIDEPRVIGERINPTGKKVFKEALLKHDIDYIVRQGLEQSDAGADILDVNVGLPGIDEKDMMVTVVNELQGVCDKPLQIDSTDGDVLNAALRTYDGIPIVNSVNGEEKSLRTVLPLVAKYGAMVIGLTLDEDGIPKTIEKRMQIAKKIIDRAAEYGIESHRIIIDCLTLTASAEQEGVMMTLNAIEAIKKEYNVLTALGVSNISFGLPNRELVNRTFLTMALLKGLDLAIINPNNIAMMETMKAYKVLAYIDKNSVKYIDFCNEHVNDVVKMPVQRDVSKDSAYNGDSLSSVCDNELAKAISKGLKEQCYILTEELLKTMDSMEIVDNILIPSLDSIGTKFEKGIIFLPQLIMSANAASACFEVIKKNMKTSQTEAVDKGTIVIATVKGDIHDIGKNIVKVLLENYGYNVIDLGKDVPYEKIADAVERYNAKLVGLSALMTTTLVSMEKTINLIHERKLDCKIMVGGAVLTEDYAMKIGADYYSKDAKQSVDIAKKVYR